MSEVISSVEGKQVNVTRIEIPPGYKTPSHSHPGESFVYILSGRIRNQIGDAEPVVYEAGGFFFEEANAIHAQFENLDTENPAVFLVFGIRPTAGN
jgi:quercetin dioxygenase-like cupin family protein